MVLESHDDYILGIREILAIVEGTVRTGNLVTLVIWLAAMTLGC